MDIEKELKRIEQEERAIYAEEKKIERGEDLLRAFEELGLMRWKSYYILTTGAILLLALTFVTSLWVMHDQIVELQTQVNGLSVGIAQNNQEVQEKLDEISSTVDVLRELEESDTEG